MTDLTEFLLARIAEDETNLPALFEGHYNLDRYIAEVEAKRVIVAAHPASTEYETQHCTTCQWDIDCDAPKHAHQDGAGEFPCPTLRALASVYADHPDYDENWHIERIRS